MNIIDIQENKNNIIKKSKDLIQAKGILSATAQKMLAMLISMIRTDDMEFQEYALHIDTYKKEIDSLSKKSKNDFIDQARELMSNPFVIDKKMFNWCSLVDWGTLDGYIIFKIDNELKPYLLQFNKETGNFTQYNLVNILHLKGKYSPKLYEYFIMQWKQYKKYHPNAKSYSFDIKMDELKELLGLTDKKYLYADIRRQIIDKAKTDFKKYTDISFTYKEQKIGRRVDRLIITVTENNQGSNDFLANKRAFIAYMRENYINADILHAQDRDTGKEMVVSVAPDGTLYDKKSTNKIEAKRADEMWEAMYAMVLSGTLNLNQIKKGE